ncbi:DUF3734 domain-containing protein [Jeongeupia chitinilytica]|uniref:Membrane protein n=1 Tax=Jeongeupia chitinilytica TaxID=1041641 RepID=A0ABQ3GY52_9NEIS|nr:patatin-like phospholipase family protein [Jeongeupia chitinilytica]GHD60844.1 membrane protein [Jeongeupia chitinilytica]
MTQAGRNPACPGEAGQHRCPGLPDEHGYQVVALALQGGGALGAYQAGVYQGLAEAGLAPNWIAGISIGALNAAIIAGNPPETRVDQLRRFWETICAPPLWPPSPTAALRRNAVAEPLLGWLNGWEAWRALTEGQRGFFVPRAASAFASDPAHASFYDTSMLKQTLEEFVDFDRVNDPHRLRVSVGAVNVRTGNFVYFDNTRHTLRAEHFMASGALPPGFPAIEIDGEYYWDGGLVSNTPLAYVLSSEPGKQSLVFQVDLWSAGGALPDDLSKVMLRQKEIQYSSRTRMMTSQMSTTQQHRRLLRDLMALVPEQARDNAAYRRAAAYASDRRFNVIHLIYKDKECEGHYKDYQFGALSMHDHWQSGHADVGRSLARPGWLDIPDAETPFVTHDVHRN